MTSLTEQMEELQTQQAILAGKIKEAEERHIKDETNTLENLELTCEGIRHQIRKFKNKCNPIGSSGRTCQLIRLTTIGIFENLLDIIKKQDERIKALEDAN